jgi:hypothetical protein
MTPRKLFINVALLLVSIAVAVGVVEIAFRVLDGYRFGSLSLVPLSNSGWEPADATLAEARKLTFAKDFDAAWYSADPPPYDTSQKLTPPADWDDAIKNYRKVTGRQDYAEKELGFLYNDKWLEEACATGNPTDSLRLFKRYPGFVYSFASPDGSTRPPYRLVPHGKDSEITNYNNFGFRGPDIAPLKPDRIIRIAFLGASVTQNGWPYTYPEYAVNYLRLWAKAKHLDVDFDLINAARGGINSASIAKIMHYEVAPLRPDIVLYYEGANDFFAKTITRWPDGGRPSIDPANIQSPEVHQYLPLEQYSAFLRRLYELVYERNKTMPEPTKAPHSLTFDLNQTDPDLNRNDLPFELHRQIEDLKSIARDVKSIGAQFAMASYVAMVRDGLRLNPNKNRYLWAALNVEQAPLTYAEIRAAFDFENRVYRKLALTENWLFLELDSHYPKDPNHFMDMVHHWGTGAVRLQGWILAQLLAPYIMEKIENGKLPRPGKMPDPQSLGWVTAQPKKFDLDCLPD